MDDYSRRRRDFSNSLDHRFSNSYDYSYLRNYNFNRRGSAPSGKFFSLSGPDSFYGSSSGMAGTSLDGENTNAENGPRTNLIVNYLPQSMTDKDLYVLFSPFGVLESCRVMRDYKTGYSYGFGFVKYLREEDAWAAIGGRDGFAVQNKRLKVSFARPSSDAIKGTNLYVSNLPQEITEYQLEVIFGKYGRIVQKNILRDKMGICRGVAFVRYDRREEAQEAISALNNVIPEGGKKPLSVKIAEEHGKLKASQFMNWNFNMNQNRGGNQYNYQGNPCMPRMNCVYQRSYNFMSGCGPPYIAGQDKRYIRSKAYDGMGEWTYGNTEYNNFGSTSNNYSPSSYNHVEYNPPDYRYNARNPQMRSKIGFKNNGNNPNDRSKKFKKNMQF